jgi:NitT/TauT family transport system permease protein
MKAESKAPDAKHGVKERIESAQARSARGKEEQSTAPYTEYESQHTTSTKGKAFNYRRLRGWSGVVLRGGTALLAIALMVLIWWAVAVLGNYPSYILPTPAEVGEDLWSLLVGTSLFGSLFKHAWTTLQEAGLGFLLAFGVGTSLGYVIGHSRALERFLSPYIAVSQGLPVVALAPLLAIWFDDNLLRNVVIVALIVFFPILVNTIVGVRSIDRTMYEVARIEGANFLQRLWYVELPLGLRALLGGIKLGLTLAITGAVIGEFVSAGSGLGFLLMAGRGQFDASIVFAGLVSLATLTVIMYTAVTVLEKVLIDWE